MYPKNVFSNNLYFLATLFLCLFATACIAPQPNNLPPHSGDQYPGTPGPSNVGHFTFTATDNNRDGRTINIDVWYPVDTSDAIVGNYRIYPLLGPLGITSDFVIADAPISSEINRPLVVFSHGYRSNSLQSIPLMETLASHGFIVVSPEHTGNSQSTPTDDYETAAANRVPDISFVIDTMLARSNDPEDIFYNRVNASAIGVTGNSMGGNTAMGIATGWAGTNADLRVDAVAPISGQIGLFESELPAVTIPVLLLGGTLDTVIPIAQNDLGYALIPAPVYQANIIGATHTHFANICAFANFLFELGFNQDTWPLIGAEALLGPFTESCSPGALDIDEVHRLQNLYIVAFFKKYLLFLSDYNTYLTEEYTDINEPNANFKAK